MNVRDALEADASALATLADAPTDVMANLVHDRTVRVAEPTDTDSPPSNAGSSARYGDSALESVLGFVSFDARKDTVYVTQLDGTPEAVERLLEEPVRFARRESMAVEVLIAPENDELRRVLEANGFESDGEGPRFDDGSTHRFRLEP